MQLGEKITEAEMARRWARAEMAGVRQNAADMRSRLIGNGLDPEAIASETVLSPESASRVQAAIRYEHGRTLDGFPYEQVEWFEALLEDGDTLLLLPYPDTLEWTSGTFKPADAIAGFRSNRHLDAVEAAIEGGEDLPPMICVAASAADPVVVLDGNQRAVAHEELGTPRPLPIILGVSSDLPSWGRYAAAISAT